MNGNGRLGVRSPSRILVALLLAMPGVACGGGDGGEVSDAAGEEWRVERTENEDGVTVVRNLAGSRWGGDAEAREELSIGVLEGADEYMLSRPSAVRLTDDAVFVLDAQDDSVRVYDYQGEFLYQVGQEGQGPGEFQNPMALTISDGRLYVGGGMSNGRVAVFSTDGTHIEDWSLGSFSPAFQLVETVDGIYSRKMEMPQPGDDFMDRGQSFQRVGPDGFEGDPIEIPRLGTGQRFTVEAMGREMRMPVPGGPMATVASLSPDLHLVVGFPDDYRFEIRGPGAEETLIVERYWDPVPISEAESAETVEMMLMSLRQQVPDVEVGDIVYPEHRAAYANFRVHRDRRIWVMRQGRGTREEGCEMPETFTQGVQPDQCWSHENFSELFDLEGNYLGAVTRADGEPLFAADVLGDRVATIEQDEFDTPMVKVYRLVLPGDPDS